MELKEYCFRNERTLKEISDNTKITCQQLTKYNRRKQTPNLLTAMLLHHETGGEVGFEELLSSKDLEKFKELVGK